MVKVTSPSTEHDDTGDKLVEYFSVPSIRDSLVADATTKVVVHHARNAAGEIATRVASSGEISLAPPGMAVPVSQLLPQL